LRSGASFTACSAEPRFQPWWAARGAHSSHTIRGSPAAMNVSGCSPRKRRRPQTSQATSGWEVTIDLALIG
jgi:hypothetical protein